MKILALFRSRRVSFVVFGILVTVGIIFRFQSLSFCSHETFLCKEFLDYILSITGRYWDIPPIFFADRFIYLLRGAFSVSDYFMGAQSSSDVFKNTYSWVCEGGTTVLAALGSAMLSVMSTVLIYFIGKRIYGKLWSLLAVFLLVFSPIHILNAHDLHGDSLYTFLLSAIVFLTLRTFEKENILEWLCAGAMWGVSSQLNPMGVLAVTPLLSSFFLTGFIQKNWKSLKFYRRFFWVGLGGLVIYFTWFLCRFGNTDFASSAGLLGQGHGAMEYFQRARECVWILSKNYGKPILFLCVLSIFFVRSGAVQVILISYPFIHILYLVLNTNLQINEQNLGSLTPFLALIPVGFLFALWNRWRQGTYMRLAVMMTLILGMAVRPVFSSIELHWLFSHEDTQALARQWIHKNLPMGSRLLISPSLLGHVKDFQSYQVFPLQAEGIEQVRKQGDFFCVSNVPGEKTFLKNMDLFHDRLEHHLLRKFELRCLGAFQVPTSIYMFQKSEFQPQKSVYLPKLFQPKAGSDTIFVGGFLPYGVDPVSGFFSTTSIFRTVVADKPLKVLGIQIWGGSSLEKVQLQMAGQTMKFILKPYEEKMIEGIPNCSFPFFKSIYRIAAKMEANVEGGGFRLLTNPYELGIAAFEAQQYSLARKYFQKAVEMPSYAQDAHYWLGISCVAGGDFEAARQSFKKGVKESPLKDWEIVAELPKGKRFDQAFEHFSSIDPFYYRKMDSLVFEAEGLYSEDGVGVNIEEGPKIIRYHSHEAKQGFLVFRPYQYLPRGAYEAVFSIRVKPHLHQSSPSIVKADVYSNRVLNERVLFGKDIREEETYKVRVSFYHERPWEKLEFRLQVFDSDVWFDKVTIVPDLRATLRLSLKRIYEALAQVHQWEGDLSQAIEDAEKAFHYGPFDIEVRMLLGKLLLKKGHISEALETFRSVQKSIPQHEEALKILINIVPEDQKKEIERQLKELRPQESSLVHFDDGIDFLGFDFSKKKVVRGEEFEVVYYWKCRSPVRGPYAIFVHFEGMNSVFFQDHDPLAGQYPTSNWKSGEIIKEKYRVRVPENVMPGQYQVKIGLWNPRGNQERLDVVNTELLHPDKTVIIAQIEVT